MNNEKIAVVVGATGVIGKEVCTALESKGYTINPVWNSIDHPDATSADSYVNLPDKIDVAIYLAGINKVTPTNELTEEDWDDVINVNLKGAYLFFKSAFPALKNSGNACLMAMSSIMVTHPYPQRLPYAVSKAGIESMIRSLAVEWGEFGISSHAIRLGHISKLMKSTKTNPRLLESVKNKIPNGHLIDPKEVAEYIVWAAETRCKSISGSIIDFDPAYTINRWPVDGV